MQVIRSRMLLAAALVAVASACDDSTGLGPTLENRETSHVVYAMNGTAQTLPAGLHVRSRAVTNIDPSWSFDLAFDIDTAGFVVIHTVRVLGSQILGSLPRVGLQTDTTQFGNVTKSPAGGFVYDSSLTVGIGRTVLFDKVDPSCNAFSGAFLGFNIRAKLRVDSVDVPRRAIYLRMLANSNCGFRSLSPGQPKE
jgi:hypothetical protein